MYARPMVRLAGSADVPRLAEVLADAFEDDPLTTWIFGGDDGVRERIRKSFAPLLSRVYVPKGHSYTTEDLAGAALWAPPGKWKLSVFQQLRIAPLFLRLVPRQRVFDAARLQRSVEHSHPADAHWHLAVLGVDPKRQRSGVGAALLRPILERADAERVLCHLETSKAENIPYYERHGFHVTTDLEVPPTAPPVWTMTRRPL